MGSRSGIAILAVLCVILSGIVFFMAEKKDQVAPEIIFEKKSIYYDGQDASTLLDGVSAADDRDGDVTDSLIVSSIYRVSDETGVVVYAAKDTSNNVTTRGRGFFYEGYDASNVLGLTNTENIETGADAPELAGMSDTASGNPEGEPEPIDAPEPVDAPEDGSMTEEEYENLKAANLAQGIPFVRLVQHEVTLGRGTLFNIYRYIDEAVDDVDTISTMLRVRGNVDTATPGVYEVSVLAMDSDGNESNVETLVVTIE